MDKNLILRTAVTQWDNETQCYATASPQAIYLVGTGETPDDALADFNAHLDVMYGYYLKGKHGMFPRKVGRPAQGRIQLTTRLKPDIKTALEQLAKLHSMSQGEIIESLVDKLRRNEVSL